MEDISSHKRDKIRHPFDECHSIADFLDSVVKVQTLIGASNGNISMRSSRKQNTKSMCMIRLCPPVDRERTVSAIFSRVCAIVSYHACDSVTYHPV